MAMSTPGSVRVAFWHATVFRRFWVSNLLASFVQPLLYLLGLGRRRRRARRPHAHIHRRAGRSVIRRVHRARAHGDDSDDGRGRRRACGR